MPQSVLAKHDKELCQHKSPLAKCFIVSKGDQYWEWGIIHETATKDVKPCTTMASSRMLQVATLIIGCVELFAVRYFTVWYCLGSLALTLLPLLAFLYSDSVRWLLEKRLIIVTWCFSFSFKPTDLLRLLLGHSPATRLQFGMALVFQRGFQWKQWKRAWTHHCYPNHLQVQHCQVFSQQSSVCFTVSSGSKEGSKDFMEPPFEG